MNEQRNTMPDSRNLLLNYLATLRPEHVSLDEPVHTLTRLALPCLQAGLASGKAPEPLTLAQMPASVPIPAVALFDLYAALGETFNKADLWQPAVRAWLHAWVRSCLTTIGSVAAPTATLDRLTDMGRAILNQPAPRAPHTQHSRAANTPEPPKRSLSPMLQEIAGLAVGQAEWVGVVILEIPPDTEEWQVLAAAGRLAAYAGQRWPLATLATNIVQARPTTKPYLLSVAEQAALPLMAGSAHACSVVGVAVANPEPAVLLVLRAVEAAGLPEEGALLEALGIQVGLALKISRLMENISLDTASRDAFLSTLNHDLKAPLATIKAHADLMIRRIQRRKVDLASPEGEADLLDRLDQIGTRARDLGRQIDAVVDSSRLEAGRLTLHRERESLSIIVAQTMDELQTYHPERTITAEITRDQLWSEADAHRIVQIIKILVSNALKFSPPDTPVAVRLSRQADSALLEVQDWGSGMDMAEAQERFRRARYRRNDQATEGIGLNLYIAAGLTKLHGGRLSVESTPGVGSTFMVHLPLMTA